MNLIGIAAIVGRWPRPLLKLLITLSFGLACAAALAGVAVGGFAISPRGFAARYGDIGTFVVRVLLGGAASGLVAGLLLPLLRWRAGAALAGALAALPGYLLIASTIYGPFRVWDGSVYLGVVGLALLLGSGAGLAAHFALERIRRGDAHR